MKSNERKEKEEEENRVGWSRYLQPNAGHKKPKNSFSNKIGLKWVKSNERKEKEIKRSEEECKIGLDLDQQ